MKKQKNVLFSKMLRNSMLLLAPVLFFLVSCNDGESHGGGMPDTNFKVNCVKLSREQIKNWVDSGWTKPGAKGQINEVVLQFLGSKGSMSLQLVGYPGDSPVSVKDLGKVTLAADTTCKSSSFTSDVILGNNLMMLGNLKIFNNEGGLNEFEYIRLTPEQTYPPYVNFKVEVVTKEQTVVADDNTRPCPAWCNDDDD
jgi:hypothetical protein